jgi:UDP-glucose 4-epimerase
MTGILVTGAGGFVGRTLCPELRRQGYSVRAAARTDRSIPADTVDEIALVGDIDSRTDWRPALRDVDVVIHLAARVHISNDTHVDAYMETNDVGTRRLALAAADAGVRRFIFVSSVKVNGEESGNVPFNGDDTPRPSDAYGISKARAEQGLREISASSGMEVLCVRPPLVYGPGVRANFLRLLSWVDRSRPLPLGAVDNRRSLVSVWNLSSFLTTAVDHSAAAGHTWMISDGEDVSTADLIRRLGRAMGRRVHLLSVPPAVLYSLASLVGKKGDVARLCGSLAVNSAPARHDLGWTPPLSLDEGLRRTVEWYLREGRAHAA